MSVARLYVASDQTKKQAMRAVRRDARSKWKGRGASPRMMNAYQRRSELQKLALYRIEQHLALGHESRWIMAICNMLAVIDGRVSEDGVRKEFEAYGIGGILSDAMPVFVSQIAGKYWGGVKLFTPRECGVILDVSSVERDECGVLKIEAVDESHEDRRKRLDKERKQRKRAAQAARAPKRETMDEKAKALGVSRSTLYRMIRAGNV